MPFLFCLLLCGLRSEVVLRSRPEAWWLWGGWRVGGAGGGLSGGLFSFLCIFTVFVLVCCSNRVYDAVLGRRCVRLWLALLAKMDVFDSCAGDAGASDGWACVLVGVAYVYLPILGLFGFGAGCGVSRRAR
ncbi:hypothetical protein QQ045_021970 [Rhodiola kirilowii]